MKSKSENDYYLVHYRDPKEGQLTSLKVRKIQDSSLGLSFVRLSDFVFETESIVVKPSEEQLKKRFENVKSFHLSIYHIVSIEEVGARHSGLKFKKTKSNLISFPTEFGHPK